MTQLIPLLQTSRQVLTTTLGTQAVKIRVWWQPSDKAWYTSIDLPPGTPAIQGRRITTDSPLIPAHVQNFQGNIFCRALAKDTNADPAFNAWGATHSLQYES